MAALLAYGTHFNPHPARKPGATRRSPTVEATLLISTLTRRESRVRRSRRLPVPNVLRDFNPHPARKPGATGAAGAAGAAGADFNPHPARKPGATWCGCSVTHNVTISTLTRRESRVRRGARRESSAARYFNPHPARKPGATSPAQLVRVPWATFQPSPGAKAGCDEPRPHVRRVLEISTLTRRESRVRPASGPASSPRWSDISTLTRRESRVRLMASARCANAHWHFNPHPARKPGATRIRHW